MNRSAVAEEATTEPRPHRLTREDFIPEAWLIDVKRATLTRHRAPEGGRYADVEVLGSLREVAVPGVDGLSVDLSTVFRANA